MIANGLTVLSYWACYATDLSDFEILVTNRVLQEILLSPNSSLENQSVCVDLFSRLIHSADIFAKLMAISEQSLLFNRMARMLSSQKKYTIQEGARMTVKGENLLGKVVSLFSTQPTAEQFTRGKQNELDGEKVPRVPFDTSATMIAWAHQCVGENPVCSRNRNT